MFDRLEDVKVDTAHFREAHLEFLAPTQDDRWPENHRDEYARGKPKDGALLLNPHGLRAEAAAKILPVGLKAAPFQWPGHETR